MSPHKYRQREIAIGLDVPNFFLPEPLAFLESSDVNWIQYERTRYLLYLQIPATVSYGGVQ